MEGHLSPQALIPSGAPFDLGQPLHFAATAQAQAVQVHQGVIAATAMNKMQEFGNVVDATAMNKMQEFGNVVDTSLREEEGADHGKAAVSASPWPRVKWTSDMVKLLVSAVSYIDPDHGTSSGRRKHTMLKTKGKWRLVSFAMTKRKFTVSPQQCEDKFNDLNKRYRRLTEILGQGMASEIVKKPALLQHVSLSGKLREEAKKHLRSKHLHYEEMHSYHNHNRSCLPDDPDLQRSLHMALRGLDEQGNKCSFGYGDEDDPMLLSDGDDEDDGFNVDHRHPGVHGTKKQKHDHEGGHCGSDLSKVVAVDTNRMSPERIGGSAAEKNPSGMNASQVERERLKIKGKMLKLEQSHFKWLKYSEEEDRELQKMKLENERMQLEYEQLEQELKLKEIEMGIKPKRIY